MGHWGRASAARKAPEIDLAKLPIVESAQCSNCERWTPMPEGKLPDGWVSINSQALCPDCAPEGPHPGDEFGPVLTAAITPAKTNSIGSLDKPSRHIGCRFGHEFILGMAAIQIRAGAQAPEGRDEAVSFLIDANGIDQLIIELSAIRKELSNG